MALLKELTAYLRSVEAGAPLARPADSSPSFDLAAARKHLLSVVPRSHPEVSATVRFWMDGDQLRNLLEDASRELRGGLCAGESDDTVQRHLHWIVELLVGVSPKIDKVTRAELDRIMSYEREDELVELAPEKHAHDLRLVRWGERPVLSKLGRVFLTLPAAEALRWLLRIETMLASGDDDPWYVSTSILRKLVDRLWVSSYVLKSHGESERSYELRKDARLIGLGLVYKSFDVDGEPGFGLNLSYRPLLQELLSGEDSPLSVLAAELLEEERGTVGGLVRAPQFESAAASAQTRYAEMVVHEVRNALVPMQANMASLQRVLRTHAADAAASWAAPHQAVEQGIARMFRFVDELQRTAQLSASLRSSFDVAAAIADALGGLNGSLGAEVTLDVAEGLPSIEGSREHFTVALVNVLRNAAQNSGKPRARIALRATASAARDTLAIAIDDDGPGVPVEHRERVFERGVSLRLGGSGQGLHFVRTVVETELRGTVRCEASAELGGARFVIELPAGAKESK